MLSPRKERGKGDGFKGIGFSDGFSEVQSYSSSVVGSFRSYWDKLRGGCKVGCRSHEKYEG